MSTNSSRTRNQIATKPPQRFGTPTIECPRGGNVRKYTSDKECVMKTQKTTVHHFGFMEKIYGLLFSTTPQQHNTSLTEGGLPLLVYYTISNFNTIYIYKTINFWQDGDL